MSPRMQVASLLGARLGGEYRVEPAKVSIDHTDRPVVIVDRAAIEPGGPLGAVDHTLDVLLVSEHVDVLAAEADLDARLPVVLAALDELAVGVWTRAERVQYGEAEYHAYRITYTVTRETP